MNRKQFILSHGATCQNWTWSWSFVNHAERVVIFGAWDVAEDGNKTLILDEVWALSRRGKRQPAYPQSREHIRLVEDAGYRLKTFRMVQAKADESDQDSPAKIADFVAVLQDKHLLRLGTSWYAADEVVAVLLPEEVDPTATYKEGAVSTVLINQYERNRTARKARLDHHGLKCSVCEFDFEVTYGPLGKGYIHVHHLVPLAAIAREYELNPVQDLVPICPNCHAMIHSTNPALTIEQLRGQLRGA